MRTAYFRLNRAGIWSCDTRDIFHKAYQMEGDLVFTMECSFKGTSPGLRPNDLVCRYLSMENVVLLLTYINEWYQREVTTCTRLQLVVWEFTAACKHRLETGV